MARILLSVRTCGDPWRDQPDESTMLRALRFATLALSVLAAGAARADWPERPVVIVVPFAPGGITDLAARLTAERLQASFKQTFIIENQPGAAGVIAAERVAKAAPDGYTLLFTPVFQITMAPFTHAIKFDPVKDFAPIAVVATSPFVITVGAAVPATTLAEFIAYVKSKPGQIPYASAGTGSLTQVSSAVFLHSAGIDMIHVPYKGVAPAFTDLLAGHVAMVSATPVELKPYLSSGTVKPLAISSSARSPQLPNVPTINETIPSPPILTYNGLVAPANTPGDIVAALSRDLMAASKSPEFLERLAKLGVDPLTNTPAEFAAIIAADAERCREIVRQLGIKAE
jgi:tripartite-type tricarboxylate transporter receptor subunit TctC